MFNGFGGTSHNYDRVPTDDDSSGHSSESKVLQSKVISLTKSAVTKTFT